MKVRRIVIAVVHLHNNTEEPADFRHAWIVFSRAQRVRRMAFLPIRLILASVLDPIRHPGHAGNLSPPESDCGRRGDGIPYRARRGSPGRRVRGRTPAGLEPWEGTPPAAR